MAQGPAAFAKEAARAPIDLNPRRDAALDFPDGDLGDLTPADYDTLGFLCGLEVHQQLATAGKLFCRCPAGRRTTRVDAEVLRHMRPTLSELGEYDGTALMEFKTRKEIVYLLERGSVCTYEMDDTPPFPIDPEAVKVALEVSRLLGLSLVSELHVMRKQYLDGSIPAGFQRTAMVGLGGEVPFRESELGPGRAIRIRQLSLEEDSCREVSDAGHRIVFRTDRLGTPLTETVTEPDLLTPLDVRRGAALLAAVAHATGKVRRGAGTARQDVNVSVAGGRRVELKGVPSHRILPRLVHVEAFRQLNLLRIAAELSRRGVTADLLSLPDDGIPWEVSPLAADARPALRRSDFEPLRRAFERDEMVAAVRLPGFGGLLSHRTQPGTSFASELAGRVRVIACLESHPFMIHSGVEDFGVKGSEWAHLRKALGAGSRSADDVVVLWGPARDVATACREVLARAREALEGVPAETRQAFRDGTTGFERILPGADRMYPDTDTPPVPIPDAWVEEVTAALPEPPWARAARYRERGLSDDAASRLAGAAAEAGLFDALDPKTPDAARRLADRLLVPRRGALASAAVLSPLVRRLEEGGPFRHAFAGAFEALAKGEVWEPAAGDLDVAVSEVRRRLPEVRSTDPAARLRFAMGVARPFVLGRVEPLDVAARLREVLR